MTVEAPPTPAVSVYSRPHCPQCDMTKRVLEREGIPYTAVDVTEDESAYRYNTDTLNYRQAPVVVVDGGTLEHWSGFRPDLIKTNITNPTTQEN